MKRLAPPQNNCRKKNNFITAQTGINTIVNAVYAEIEIKLTIKYVKVAQKEDEIGMT